MQTPPSCESYILPDLLHISQPFKASTNPHWLKAAPESSAWVSSYRIFTDRKRMEFILGSNELLASHTYPQANYDTFRTCCDFINLLFVIDEISDDQSGEGARLTGKVFLNAMRDPECTDGSILAKMTRDFRARLLQSIGAQSFRRFLKILEDYIESVTKEAEYREHGYVLDMEQFKILRRQNSAVRCAFGMVEHTLGIDLPDVVFEDATFMKVYWAAIDMVWCANDVYSYSMELAKGDNHSANNIMSVFMAANGVSLQAASDYVGRHYARLMEEYLSARAELASKSFGSQELDSDVLKYIDAMENWPIGNIEWSFKTSRYFGPQNDEVKQTLVVKLKPQEVPA